MHLLPDQEPPIAPGRVWQQRRSATVGGVCVASVVIVLALILLLRAPLPAPARAVTRVAAATTTPAPAAPRVGHFAPPLTATTLSGAPARLATYRGDVVLLNFWYAACDPCRYEMPTLEHTYESDRSKGVVVLGVNTTDDSQSIAAFQQSVGITYPLVRDGTHASAAAYAVLGTPSSYLIDRQGVIRAVYVGPVHPATLSHDLAALLAGPPTPTR